MRLEEEGAAAIVGGRGGAEAAEVGAATACIEAERLGREREATLSRTVPCRTAAAAIVPPKLNEPKSNSATRFSTLASSA